MLRFIPLSAVALFFADACRAAIAADGICRPTCTADECTFNVRLNLHASETGLYQVRPRQETARLMKAFGKLLELECGGVCFNERFRRAKARQFVRMHQDGVNVNESMSLMFCRCSS